MGGLGTEQVAHEIVPAAARHVKTQAAVAVVLVGKQQQVEILVGFDERLDDQQRVVGRNVVVERAMREHQMALQIFCEILIRLVIVVSCTVLTFHQQSLVVLAPIVFIFPIVVIPGLGDADLEKIRVAEHRIDGGVSSAGMAPDADAGNINPEIFFESGDQSRMGRAL